jgi:hypothetical protein
VLLEAYGRKVARVGIVLGAISPATVVLGAVWFSEAVSRFCLGLFLYLLLIAFKNQDWKRAALAGLALGYAFDTRPLTALAIGSVTILLLAIRSCSWKQRTRIVCAAGAGFAAVASLTFVWNYKMTGDPLRPTFIVMQRYDQLGFGPRGNQYVADPAPPTYTPQAAARRVISRSLPAMVQSALGVGFYDFRLYQWLGSGTIVTRLKVLGEFAGFLLPALLLGFSFAKGEHRFFSVLFASIAAANLLAYSLYFFDGATWGFTPLHTRYQTEAIMFGFLPLMARGVVAFRERISLNSAPRKLALALAVGLLGWNYAHYCLRISPSLQPRGLAEMEQALSQVHSERAVVFYAGVLDAPLGDYPFTSLEEARIVTYRLTKDRMWGLQGDNPEDLYQRYFQGRDAFLFRDGKLVKLDLPTATREKL